MAQKIRTFVAVNVGPEVRAAIEHELPKLVAVAPQLNWTKSENYHFTLAFLGDVRDTEVPEICKVMSQAVQSIEEFEVEIVGLTAFPSAQRIKYIWAGVGLGKDELCQLQAAVAEAANRLGFPKDRDVYTPHLTIARVGRGAQPAPPDLSGLEALATRSFGVSAIDEVIVYASYLDKTGPTYVPLSTIPLSY